MRQLLVISCVFLMLAQSEAPRAAGREAPQASLPPGAEAVSLFGKPLVPPQPSPEVRQTMEARLAEARTAHERAPTDPEAIIWLGRRTAYLGRYQEAIAIYTKGIERHPRNAKLYRHRGHRYISVRQFDRAIADLEKAASLIAGVPDEIEPDGLPNARNTPTSTSHSNIWYHLGLAYYLTGDFGNALRAYHECLTFSKNPDMLVATSHWLYMILRRLDRPEDAAKVLDPIRPDLDIIENGSYHRLLLMYKGLIPPDVIMEKASAGLELVTSGYGVGNWHLYNGRREAAVAIFRKILQSDQWAPFGYIAAEADLKRLNEPPGAADGGIFKTTDGGDTWGASWRVRV